MLWETVLEQRAPNSTECGGLSVCATRLRSTQEFFLNGLNSKNRLNTKLKHNTHIFFSGYRILREHEMYSMDV